MRYAAFGCLTALVLATVSARADERDEYEQKYVERLAAYAVRAEQTQRAQWKRTLEAAFPGKVTDARDTDEYGAWFDLLADNDGKWQRTGGVPAIVELFDRVKDRLRIGPVPSITREEFLSYARRELRDRDRDRDDEDEDEKRAIEYADRVFRVLDQNTDGELLRDELTAGLKAERLKADEDSNGRISKEEYRSHFRRMLAAKTEALAKRPDPRRPGAATVPGGLEREPAWFVTFDTDMDAQISLFEWRKGGKTLAEYTRMDLNADGLLTRAEYERYVTRTEQENQQKMREEKAKGVERK